jgi:hypothetical protein
MRRSLGTHQTLDLEEEEWLTGIMNLLPSERTQKIEFLEESAPLYLSQEYWLSPIHYMGAL